MYLLFVFSPPIKSRGRASIPARPFLYFEIPTPQLISRLITRPQTWNENKGKYVWKQMVRWRWGTHNPHACISFSQRWGGRWNHRRWCTIFFLGSKVLTYLRVILNIKKDQRSDKYDNWTFSLKWKFGHLYAEQFFQIFFPNYNNIFCTCASNIQLQYIFTLF